ncbi:MAG: hypothetical protein WAL72_12635 [Streptosporangiaceae bacterium]
MTILHTGGRAELERLRVNATLQRPRHQSERIGDLKSFELKTMCLLVTLSDRAEAVVAVPTAIDAQAGGAVMASRQVRVTGRAVLDRGE